MLQNREESLDLFINRILKISEKPKQKNINIMIENNVLSRIIKSPSKKSF